jgi:hypothetical protein
MERILVFSVRDGNSYNRRTIFSFLLKMKAAARQCGQRGAFSKGAP